MKAGRGNRVSFLSRICRRRDRNSGAAGPSVYAPPNHNPSDARTWPLSPSDATLCLVSEQTFNEPKIALNRIYTRVGDRGETRLVGGQTRSKTDSRIECYGT